MTGDMGSGSTGFEGRLIEFKRSARDFAQTEKLREDRGRGNGFELRDWELSGMISLWDLFAKVIQICEHDQSMVEPQLIGLNLGLTWKHPFDRQCFYF